MLLLLRCCFIISSLCIILSYLVWSYFSCFYHVCLTLPFPHHIYLSVCLPIYLCVHTFFYTYATKVSVKRMIPLQRSCSCCIGLFAFSLLIPYQVWLNQGFSRQPMRTSRRRGFRPSRSLSDGHVYRAVLHRVDEKPLGTRGSRTDIPWYFWQIIYLSVSRKAARVQLPGVVGMFRTKAILA